MIFLLFSVVAVSAAEVTIDSSPYSSVDVYRKNMVAFSSDQVGYVFYLDSSRNLVYNKTTDGGATWGTKVALHSGLTSDGPIIWYDKWTPGDTGTKIHVIHATENDDDIYYIEFDTSDDSYSTPIKINGTHTTGNVWTYTRYYISKSIDGVLYVAQIDDESNLTYSVKCSGTCTTDTNWSDAGTLPFSSQADGDVILMPIENGDILGINQRDASGGIYWAKYSSVTNTWGSQTLLLGVSQVDSYRSPWGATVNPDNYDVYFTIHNNPYSNTSTIYTYLYNAGTWTAKTNLDSSNAQVPSVSLGLDRNNGDVYAAYPDQNGYRPINQRSSANGMTTWSSYVYLCSANTDAYRSISVNLINDERLYAVWFDDTNDDLVGITIADLAAPIYAISFSPVDNGYFASVDSNLSILFSRSVDIQTGNIYLKNASSDKIVETISVSQLSGNGTTTVTIDPAKTLAHGGQYYVEIDSGLFVDSSSNIYAGFTDNGTWNFASSDWYNSNWLHRIKITVNGSDLGESVSNFPVYVDLADFNGKTNFFESMKSDGSDIRITKDDGVTEVAREIVSVDTSSNGGELHFVANGTMSNLVDTDFFLYYGNSAASDYAVTDTYGAENVWINNYSGVYHLEEDHSGTGTASVYSDSTASSYDGTDYISDTVKTGYIGNGQSFDGTDDYIQLPSLSTDYSLGFSVCAWVYYDSYKSWSRVVDLGQGSSDDNLVLANNSTTSNLSFASYNGASGTIVTASSVLSTSTWLYLCGTVDSAGSSVIYVDGGSVQTGSTGAPQNVTRNLSYIAKSNWADGYFDGRMDEIRLSNTQRSGTWIETEYNNMVSPGFFVIGDPEEKPVNAFIFFTP